MTGHTFTDSTYTGWTDRSTGLRKAASDWQADATAAEATYGHMSTWDTSQVTDFTYAFYGVWFNEDLSHWDVSNATKMDSMFNNAGAFNQDIGDWDVSSVTSMQNMFRYASAFDGDIGDWDVSSVKRMDFMFAYDGGFNQDIGDWDVSTVSNMTYMFYAAWRFNQDIGGWDVSNVTNMQKMFGARSVPFDHMTYAPWYAAWA